MVKINVINYTEQTQYQHYKTIKRPQIGFNPFTFVTETLSPLFQILISRALQRPMPIVLFRPWIPIAAIRIIVYHRIIPVSG